MIDIKNKLDIADKMIDCVQRKIQTTENMMGMVNSAYEYETFFGNVQNKTALNELKTNGEALHILLKYRTDLLNYAAGIGGSEPDLSDYGLSDLENFSF